ncbi:melanopsin-like [Diadema antillarum]|uniref:melanopsin-like n=1 Tax=Diadema antillarum TaxID=105358 RepID=UPI003A88E2D5
MGGGELTTLNFVLPSDENTMLTLSAESMANETHSYHSVVDIAMASALCVMALIGVTGNVFILLAIALSRKLQTKDNIFIVSLSISDMLVCLVQPPQIPGMIGKNEWPLPMWFCDMIAALNIVSVSTSVITIMAIGLNRCVLITRSRETYNRLFSTKIMIGTAILSWVMPPIALAALEATGNGCIGYDTVSRFCICEFQKPSAKPLIYVIAVSVFVIFVINMVSYWLILRRVRKSVFSAAKRRASENSLNTKRDMSRVDRQSLIEFKITMNMLCVISCFTLSICPYACVLLAITFLQGHRLHVALRSLSFVGPLLVVDSCLNPVIYGSKHPKIRVVIGHMLRGRWGKIPQPSRLLQRFNVRRSSDRDSSASSRSFTKPLRRESQSALSEARL